MGTCLIYDTTKLLFEMVELTGNTLVIHHRHTYLQRNQAINKADFGFSKLWHDLPPFAQLSRYGNGQRLIWNSSTYIVADNCDMQIEVLQRLSSLVDKTFQSVLAK